jgi:hypothetical protein
MTEKIIAAVRSFELVVTEAIKPQNKILLQA